MNREDIKQAARLAALGQFKVAFLGGVTKAIGTVAGAARGGIGVANQVAGRNAKALLANSAATELPSALGRGYNAFKHLGGAQAAGQLGLGAAALGGSAYVAGRGLEAGRQGAGGPMGPQR